MQRSVEMLKEKYGGKKLIVARDKLDYIKGVRQKMLAFEQFLVRHPEWRGKASQAYFSVYSWGVCVNIFH